MVLRSAPPVYALDMYTPLNPKYPPLAIQQMDLICEICRSRRGFTQCQFCLKILCQIHAPGENNCFVRLLNEQAERVKQAEQAKQVRRTDPQNNTETKSSVNAIIAWLKQQTNSK